MGDGTEPTDPRAYALYAEWLKVAKAMEVPPELVMVTAVGTVAEMIRANRPVSTWDEAVDLVSRHILLILKGPDPDVTDTPPAKRRHRPADPHDVRRRRRVSPRHPDQPS